MAELYPDFLDSSVFSCSVFDLALAKEVTLGEYPVVRAGLLGRDIIPCEMISYNTNFKGIDPITVEAFRALHRTFHLHRQLLDRALACKGSHPPEGMCLRVLTSRGGISQKDLADHVHLSRPRVTALLQELEAAGWVRRRVDEQDQRITRVFPTEAGQDRAKELEEVFISVFSETIGAMPDEDRRELTRLLTILADRAEQALRTAGERGQGQDSGSLEPEVTGDAESTH